MKPFDTIWKANYIMLAKHYVLAVGAMAILTGCATPVSLGEFTSANKFTTDENAVRTLNAYIGALAYNPFLKKWSATYEGLVCSGRIHCLGGPNGGYYITGRLVIPYDWIQDVKVERSIKDICQPKKNQYQVTLCLSTEPLPIPNRKTGEIKMVRPSDQLLFLNSSRKTKKLGDFEELVSKSMSALCKLSEIEP